MILTDLYLFKKNEGCKTRLDCEKSTKTYPEFEMLRDKEGKIKAYIAPTSNFKANRKRKADYALTAKSKSISSIYIPEIDKPFGYGDVSGTQDAILFTIGKDFNDLGVIIARGYKNLQLQLYFMLVEGELNEELKELFNRCQNENNS